MWALPDRVIRTGLIFPEPNMARSSRSARYTAKLKAKRNKQRLRQSSRLTKRRNGGRLVKVKRKS